MAQGRCSCIWVMLSGIPQLTISKPSIPSHIPEQGIFPRLMPTRKKVKILVSANEGNRKFRHFNKSQTTDIQVEKFGTLNRFFLRFVQRPTRERPCSLAKAMMADGFMNSPTSIFILTSDDIIT